jgi:hypothetical protein
MLESGSSGSVRGVPSNGHPYRDPGSRADCSAGDGGALLAVESQPNRLSEILPAAAAAIRDPPRWADIGERHFFTALPDMEMPSMPAAGRSGQRMIGSSTREREGVENDRTPVTL